MKFSEVQQQAINIRDKNVLVFASAGSGKTSVLVERLCQLVVKDQIPVDAVLAMTFTNDAATEMKNRLKKRLEQQADDPYIARQLTLVEDASICTIDSFCLDLVKKHYRFPITAKMTQTILDTPRRDQLFKEAYEAACREMESGQIAELNLFFQAYGKNEDDVRSAVSGIINTALSKPRAEQWLHDLREPLIDTETWFREYFLQILRSMEKVLDSIMDEITDPELICRAENLQQAKQTLEQEGYAAFRKAWIVYMNSSAKIKNKYGDIDTKERHARYDQLEKKIHEVLTEPDLLEQPNQGIHDILVTLCEKTQEKFRENKFEAEAMDFSDMEQFAYHLLSYEEIAQEVREKYEVILVDEFQDTNDLQEAIIARFARKNNVFRVGDIKQSIYGFRHAKPSIMKAHMDKVDAYSQTLVLDENYRSGDTIIRFNNDFYSRIMNVPGMEAAFSQIDIAHAGTERQKEGKPVPVRFLYSEWESWGEENGVDKVKAKTIHNKNKADILAQDILDHHKNGTPYRDMCILTRTHAPQEKIKEALEAYGIPVRAEIGHGFYADASIQIVLACLKALQDPDDDISLCALLLSPLCKVSTQDLAGACLNKEKGMTLYSQIKEQPFAASFQSLRRHRNDALPELIRKIYAFENFYEQHTDAQNKSNLDLFLELASQYPDPYDIKGFIEQHANASLADSLDEAAFYSRQADVVSIKTMHHSKGLQFPVVYLWSTHETRRSSGNPPVLIDEEIGLSVGCLDREKTVKWPGKTHLAILAKKQIDELEEEMRVFYVATTRAEKELILVDCIPSAEKYADRLTYETLWRQESTTGWLFHAYEGRSNDLIRFERIHEVYERPAQKKPAANGSVTKTVYTKPAVSFSSQTASGTKIKLQWPTVSLQPNTAAARGTLLHEAVAQVPYPYQEENLIRFDASLAKEDIALIRALNTDADYQDYMEHPHRFECPYILKQDTVISHGFMDLVVWLEDRIVIIDFKSDRVKEADELIDRYTLQLQTYKEAMETIEKKPVMTRLYSFCLQQFIDL